MTDIFVSYKREDRPAVQRMVMALRGEGFKIWWDHDIPPEAPWEATIEKHLRAAKMVIVAWSPRAITSDSVKAEARGARNAGRLIQVIVETCDPPLFFGERQGVDLVKWDGSPGAERFRALVAAVRDVLAGKRPADAIGYTPEKRPRWPLVMNAAVLVGSFGALAFVNAPKPAETAVTTVETVDPRAALLARVEGVWGNIARDGQAGCTTRLHYSVEHRDGQDFIRVTGENFEGLGRVIGTETDTILTRTVLPQDQVGMPWELRLEPDRLIQVDRDNTPTPLARCDS